MQGCSFPVIHPGLAAGQFCAGQLAMAKGDSGLAACSSFPGFRSSFCSRLRRAATAFPFKRRSLSHPPGKSKVPLCGSLAS